MAKKKFYAVANGRTKGVYDTWDETKKQVDGFQNAKYKSFPTYEEAYEFAFGTSAPTSTKKETSTNKKKEESKPSSSTKILKGTISTDAACSGNPGDLEYRLVWTDTQETIYHSEMMFGTNNLGEFLALVEAIKFVNNSKQNITIYTDSVTAIAWVRNKAIKSSFDLSRDIILEAKVKDALDYLYSNPPIPNIVKWDTKVLGEIKADFGRK